jgi:ketosteroid isomerase-like protein
MIEEDARTFADAWVAAWNRRDLDAIMNHYAKNVKVTSPLVTRRYGHSDGTLRGRKKLREYFEIGLREVPELRFELRQVLIGPGGLAIVYARENGALVVETLSLNKGGKARRVRVFYSGLPELPPD